jgi:hypothetical protein
MPSSSATEGNVPLDAIWEIERLLGDPPFRGVSVGSALGVMPTIELFVGNANWGFRKVLKDRARRYYHLLRPLAGPQADVSVCRGRVLATLLNSSTRFCDLVLPVVRCMGARSCAVLLDRSGSETLLPRGVPAIPLDHAFQYDVAAWRRDYLRFWKRLRPTVRDLVVRRGFPGGVFHRLADAVVTATQEIAGFLEFLARGRPAAILAEFDRNSACAALVLSAATLGIPTYTLIHGTLGERCRGFFPLLADKVFCWGQIDRQKLIEVGLQPERAVLGGCPRLTRDLPLSAYDARAKLGLAPQRPLVMFGTSPYQHFRQRLAEIFCQAVCGQEVYSAVVRLHPVEKPEVYAELIARFPSVKFLPSEGWPLDEALAAADVVVVHSSGLGSDALVKRRLTVVLDAIDFPLGHGRDLVELAGCPRACSAGELREIIGRLLGDQQEQALRRRSGEQFVGQFCDAFGAESAARIAQYVLARIPQAGSPAGAGCQAE